jgi:hypothetical protein
MIASGERADGRDAQVRLRPATEMVGSTPAARPRPHLSQMFVKIVSKRYVIERIAQQLNRY